MTDFTIGYRGTQVKEWEISELGDVVSKVGVVDCKLYSLIEDWLFLVTWDKTGIE